MQDVHYTNSVCTVVRQGRDILLHGTCTKEVCEVLSPVGIFELMPVVSFSRSSRSKSPEASMSRAFQK